MGPSLCACLVLVLVTIAVWLLPTDFERAHDDAYITYRYAENLAAGHGFRFNPRDPAVQGSSTPLYTLLLASGRAARVSTPLLSMAIGMAATAGTAIMLYLLGRSFGFSAAGFATGLIWAASPFTKDLLGGMETPLYIALIVGTFLALQKANLGLALLLASLAMLTRLDGLALLAVVVTACIVHRRLPLTAATVSAALLIAWFGFATLYFGSAIPASGAAKLVHAGAVSGNFSPISQYLRLLIAPVFSSLPLAALALVGMPVALWFIARLCRHRPYQLIGGWLLLYWAGYQFLALPDFPWYYGPLAALLALLLWIILEERARNRWGEQGSVITMSLAVTIAVMGSTLQVDSDWRWKQQATAAAWLSANAHQDATVAAVEVGYLGYFSGLRVLDLMGLTTLGLQEHLKAGDYAWLVREAKPDYLFLPVDSVSKEEWIVTRSVLADSQVVANYSASVEFPIKPGIRYVLYERRERSLGNGERLLDGIDSVSTYLRR